MPRGRGLGAGLAVAGVLVVAAIAYRSLVVWDPGGPGLPDVGWFVFGVSDPAPQIVLAIVAALLFQRGRRIVRAVGGPRSGLLGIASLLTSLVLFLWGRHVDAPELQAISLAFFLLGSALFVFGRRVARELGPPLLVLLFAIPIPGIVLNHILLPLQTLSAVQLTWLLDVLGIPVVREGVVLQLSDQTIRVIETCSGLRGMTILTMLAVCWASFFSMRPLAACLLVVSATPIALAINGARLLSISLNPYADLAAAHSFQGVAVFMAGIALLCGVDVVLRHTLEGNEEPVPASSAALPRDWQHRAMLPTLVVLAILAASIWLPIWQPEAVTRSPIAFPASVAGWELGEEEVPIDHLFLGRANVPDRVHRRYHRGGEQVVIYVAYDDRRDRTRSVLSPKAGLPGPGWTVEERRVRSLGSDGPDAHWLVARSHAHRLSVLHWYEGVEGLGSEIARAWLATDRSAFARPCGALAVRLETEQDGDSDRRLRAEARLVELAAALRPYLASLTCADSEEGGGLALDGSYRTEPLPLSFADVHRRLPPRRGARQRG